MGSHRGDGGLRDHYPNRLRRHRLGRDRLRRPWRAAAVAWGDQDSKANLTDAQKKIGSRMLQSAADVGGADLAERQVSVTAAVSDDLEAAIMELGGSILALPVRRGR